MTNFETALAFVLKSEGAWSGDPNDSGNWTGGKVLAGELKGTKYGISAASYPNLDIQNLTLTEAQAIYKSDYWDKIHGDEMPLTIAVIAFDSAVNQGVGGAIRLLQKVYGVKVDGVLGKQTLAAIQSAPTKAMAIEFLSRRIMAYTEAAGWPGNGLGWTRRMFNLADKVLG